MYKTCFIKIIFLDIIHRPVLYLKHCFGDWIPSPSSGEPAQFDPIDRGSLSLWTLATLPALSIGPH
jgi:hypothetical protein